MLNAIFFSDNHDTVVKAITFTNHLFFLVMNGTIRVISCANVYFVELYKSQSISERTINKNDFEITHFDVSNKECYCGYNIYDPRVSYACCLYLSSKVNESPLRASTICDAVNQRGNNCLI